MKITCTYGLIQIIWIDPVALKKKQKLKRENEKKNHQRHVTPDIFRPTQKKVFVMLQCYYSKRNTKKKQMTEWMHDTHCVQCAPK